VTSDLQPVLDELAAMRGLIEILASLAPATRARVITWLQHVVSPEAASAPSAPGPIPSHHAPTAAERLAASTTSAGDRLAQRIEQLSRGEASATPENGEAPAGDEDQPRSFWRGKHT
jgi:hypothetical protein